MAAPKKVLIVDDHESMRNLFEREFAPENGFAVTGSMGCAAYAPVFCALTPPDLVIMDVCTEDEASGLDAAEEILKRSPQIKLIVTSGFGEVTYITRAKEIGAHAFVVKTKGIAYYLEVANRVLSGEYVFPERKIIPVQQGAAPFTKREMQSLRMMCRGMTSQQIADEIKRSPKTVQRYMENMREKTGLKSVMELVTYVLSNGWINPNF